MKLKKSYDGSVILWTVLFANILAICIGSLMTLSLGYKSAVIRSVSDQQIYFSARSAVDIVLADLANNGKKSKLLPEKEGSQIVLEGMKFNSS